MFDFEANGVCSIPEFCMRTRLIKPLFLSSSSVSSLNVNATVDDDQCGSACPLARLVLNFCVPRDSDRADIRREYRRSSTYVRVCLFRYRMFSFSIL